MIAIATANLVLAAAAFVCFSFVVGCFFGQLLKDRAEDYLLYEVPPEDSIWEQFADERQERVRRAMTRHERGE